MNGETVSIEYQQSYYSIRGGVVAFACNDSEALSSAETVYVWIVFRFAEGNGNFWQGMWNAVLDENDDISFSDEEYKFLASLVLRSVKFGGIVALANLVRTNMRTTPYRTISQRKLYIRWVANVLDQRYPRCSHSSWSQFARNAGIRLMIKNTGHDFSGKSSGVGSLKIRTYYLKDVEFIPTFTDGAYTRPAFKARSRVQDWEIYEAVGEYRVTVVSGEGKTVGVMGGYIQGGGRSPLSSLYGIAADHILSMNIVLASGINPNITYTYHPTFYPAWASSFPLEAIGRDSGLFGYQLFPRSNFASPNSTIFNSTFEAWKGSIIAGFGTISFQIDGKLHPSNTANAGNLSTLTQAGGDARKALDERIKAWKDVSPGAGAYSGESDREELFWAKTTVGSEGWDVVSVTGSGIPDENGRLWRV
ncbi:hypothetical protein BDZ45DRAFT_806648 [Acephala macrosclerotiorum]|nr:hypothetical protein BDZ45DRAFT_806648 [Acephala macrosclerotiorum]